MGDFPNSIYSPRTKENKAGVVYAPDKKTVGYAEDLTKLDAEVVALETLLLNMFTQISDEGLVLYLPFNEANGGIAKDASKYGNDGVFKSVGEPAWSEGLKGSAVDFNGSADFIVTSLNIGISGNADRTIEGWCKSDKVDYSADDGYFFSGGEAGWHCHFGMAARGNPATWQFTEGIAWFNTGKAVTTTTWQHIIVTLKSDILYVYINGSLVYTHDFSGSVINTTNNPMNFGRYLENSGFFDGKIDEVRIFSRGLSAAEVKARFYLDRTVGMPRLAPILSKPPITFTNDDVTPAIHEGNIFKTATGNAGAQNITMFDRGSSGQTITIISSNPANASTIVDGGNLKLAGDWIDGADKTLTLVFDGSDWYEISRT